MAKVTVSGKEYGLRFDLYAMEQIEEELGSVKNAFDMLREGRQMKATRTLFKVLANSWLSYNGEKETVTGDEIKHAGMDVVVQVSEALQQAITEGSKSEATGGNEADDEVHDLYLEEIERKN
jgi:hypothetical protein